MGEARAGTVSLRLVCFELRGQELAFPIADVRETLPLQPITRVALTPSCLAGVFSLRGDIVPAIEAGSWGVHVPYEITWAMEHAEAPVAHPRFRQLAHLGELATVIAELDVP